MPERAVEMVHVGSASRDLTDDDPRGWRLGGGAPYAALTTARLGLRTAALVGVDAAASTAWELDLLRDAGVDLVLAGLETAPVFRNLESSRGRVQRARVVGSPLLVRALPAAWRAAAAWMFEPIADELPDDWVAQPLPGAMVGLGWQGLLRTLVADQVVTNRLPRPSPLLVRADVVGLSRDDVAAGTSTSRLIGLLRPDAIMAWTDGAAGGRLVRASPNGPFRSRRWAAVPAARLLDPTGAGDVFLAALMVAIMRPDLTGRRFDRRHGLDLAFAAAAASFAVEAPGLVGVPSRAGVLARLGRPDRLGEAPA